jgi:hypothetical protein
VLEVVRNNGAIGIEGKRKLLRQPVMEEEEKAARQNSGDRRYLGTRDAATSGAAGLTCLGAGEWIRTNASH